MLIKISSTINNKFWGDVMMSYSQYLENYPLIHNLYSITIDFLLVSKVGMMLVYRNKK